MTQYTSRAQLKEKARDQMAGHYGNAILLSICRSLIVFSLTFAVSMTFTMILTGKCPIILLYSIWNRIIPPVFRLF